LTPDVWLVAQDRAVAQLAVAFGVVALSLAAIGLFGVLSYGIARRTAKSPFGWR
jgi:hypothetical protein